MKDKLAKNNIIVLVVCLTLVLITYLAPVHCVLSDNIKYSAINSQISFCSDKGEECSLISEFLVSKEILKYCTKCSRIEVWEFKDNRIIAEKVGDNWAEHYKTVEGWKEENE